MPKSLAMVAGLQDTYTILAGANSRILQTTSLCIPALGGSMIIMSGGALSSASFSLMSPRINRQLEILLIRQLFIASFTSLSAISMPITVLAAPDIYMAMAPVPQ